MTRETDPMSARNDADPNTPIHYATPPAMPETQMSQPEFSERLRKLQGQITRSLARVPAEFFPDVKAWLKSVQEMRDGMTLMLPGMPEPELRKARGTLEKVNEYFAERGLPLSDASYFFNKQEGCGWKINRAPIKDWKAVVRSWEAAKYFPSQKVTAFNGAQVARPPSIGERALWRETRRVGRDQ